MPRRSEFQPDRKPKVIKKGDKQIKGNAASLAEELPLPAIAPLEGQTRTTTGRVAQLERLRRRIGDWREMRRAVEHGESLLQLDRRTIKRPVIVDDELEKIFTQVYDREKGKLLADHPELQGTIEKNEMNIKEAEEARQQGRRDKRNAETQALTDLFNRE